MKRRDFIKHGGIAGVLAAGTAPAFAQGQEIRWRMTSSFPKSLDTLYGANEQVAKRVAELTGNKFQLRTFAAGEIVPGLQVLDAVAQVVFTSRTRSTQRPACPKFFISQSGSLRPPIRSSHCRANRSTLGPPTAVYWADSAMTLNIDSLYLGLLV